MMKILVGIWAGLSLTLLVAGVLILIFSVLWRDAADSVLKFLLPFLNLDISDDIRYLLASLLSIPAFLFPPTRLLPLKALAIYTLALAVFTLSAGTVIWVFSLRELDNCSDLWTVAGPAIQQELQDRTMVNQKLTIWFSCCGYWNATASGQFAAPVGYCADLTFAATQPGCMSKVTTEADRHLNIAFTSIYACEAIIVAFALTTACLIKERKVRERFRLIDEKRGGGGFV